LEFIAVPERQDSGRFHFRLAAAFPYGIRSGFDFAACERAKPGCPAGRIKFNDKHLDNSFS
jgi:hypothetical protein